MKDLSVPDVGERYVFCAPSGGLGVGVIDAECVVVA